MITVLIAAYNASEFIDRAVLSAADQGEIVTEILVVDDASTDNTREVVRKLSLNEPRLKLVALTENGGPAKARNAGLNTASQEWVAILDADDAFLPNRLSYMHQVAQTAQADVVADNFIWYTPATSSTEENLGAPGLRECSDTEVTTLEGFIAKARPFAEEADWGLLKPIFRKAFLDSQNIRYPDFARHGEDFLLITQILLAGGRYVVTRRPGYLYSVRSSGRSRTIVNYDLQVTQTLKMLDDPRVCTNEAVCATIRMRASALEKLSVTWNVQNAMRDRKFTRTLILILTRRGALRQAVRIVMAKTMAILTRPRGI